MLTYRIGQFGPGYPLPRGISPWLVAVVATVLLGESLLWPHAVGVAVISLGLISLVFAGGAPGAGQLPAVGAALATCGPRWLAPWPASPRSASPASCGER